MWTNLREKINLEVRSHPLGYKNLKPKHQACFHEYIITEQGKNLKRAFQLKASGKYSNWEIIQKMNLRGLNINKTNFRSVFSNPFYLGYDTGKLVNGKLFPGKHPALIDLKTFMKANGILQTAVNDAIPKHQRIDQLPLKMFVKEEKTNSAFTGYKTKGHWYYKARDKGMSVNINADKLNLKFYEELKKYEFSKQLNYKLKKALLRE